MTKKARTRACGNCNREFVEARRDSDAQWQKREFCSMQCNNSSKHRVTCIFERLERFQVKQEGCWGWSGATDDRGYGILSSRDKTSRAAPEKAHRVSFEKAFGQIPEGLFVCHKCDNPPCTNPQHLFVGTAKDNSVDCSAKGRLNPQSLKNLIPGKRGVLGASKTEGNS